MQILVNPSIPHGTVTLPPSKSMAHRLLICAALANGTSTLSGLSLSEDIQATARTLKALGASVSIDEAGCATVQGIGPSYNTICALQGADCGESGSTLRFMIPLFALQSASQHLKGAERLFARPLHVYENLFQSQGLSFEVSRMGVSFEGPLQPGTFTIAGDVSSQFISGLLFALPLLQKDSFLHITKPFESRDYVELTRSAQAQFGVKSHWISPFELHIPGNQTYHPCTAAVEGDWSQAVVPAVLGAVCGPLSLAGLRDDSKQGDRVALEILKQCGANIQHANDIYTVGPGKKPLRAPERIDLSNCPDLGPVLCALALFCEGETEIYNAVRLRAKESDRIASIETEFSKLGACITTTESTIRIKGNQPLHTAHTNSHNDHRVVMALSVAAVCGNIPIQINEAEAICKSWPSFFNDLHNIGVQTEEI